MSTCQVVDNVLCLIAELRGNGADCCNGSLHHVVGTACQPATI